ncbi:flagellar basal body-associated FliL family protein [Sphingomonas cavernae]|uniref:Flagellar protein FliL n=1 Tax=Sphingomonas cavernae TaxID=2320861 RepID=A0A418W856_9SPHN|nr:flagellar basal body-associated FliL family protein [Sphingomonas cavernae]RJF86187.1 flagellar basal body protein FliL [Sphingomonas cavernae]
MSTNAISETAPAKAEEGPAPNRRKMIIVAAIGAVVLLGGAGAGFALMGGDEGEKPAGAGVQSASYVEVPPLIVNLRSSDGQARFLKLRFIVVATDPGKSEEIKEKLPVILDALQPFLRELRPEDLNGSAAVFRVKEEMMARATEVLGGGVVRDVLIQDLVQQ